LWFWFTYCVFIYPDQLEIENYKKTKEYVVAKTTIPYECTNTVDYSCNDYGGISCGQASRDLLANGSLLWSLDCQTGYHCCRTRTYCGQWARSCSTSCAKSCTTSCHTYCANWITECIQSVDRRRCRQIRGICNNVHIDVEYEVNTGTVNTIRSKHCGLNNTGCVSNYLNSYPEVGGYKDVYYNPWNTDETTDTIGYNEGAWVALAFPILYFLFLFIFTIYFEINLIKKKKKKDWVDSNREYDLDKSTHI
jgi:hypothetical protein